MYAVEAKFVNRVALREALIDGWSEGGLFVEGAYEITSGTPVTVRVSVPELTAGLFLEGLVQWRRLGLHGKGPASAPGIGVRVLPSQLERITFLQRWTAGSVESSGREDWRFPIERRVVLTTVGKHTGRIQHATLRDVSAHGAQVSTSGRLSPSSLIALEIQLDGAIHTLAARIAWSTDDRAGLRLLLERSEERLAWARVFNEAATAFTRRVIGPRRPSSGPRVVRVG